MKAKIIRGEQRKKIINALLYEAEDMMVSVIDLPDRVVAACDGDHFAPVDWHGLLSGYAELVSDTAASRACYGMATELMEQDDEGKDHPR